MDCDYPVPDIYDCGIVEDLCPCGAFLPQCEKDLSSQERSSPESPDVGKGFPLRSFACSAGCKLRTRRLRDILPVNPQKEVAVLRKLGITDDEQSEDPSPPVDCCPHNNGMENDMNQRTFLLTFNNRGDDDCMLIEKNRCKAFWEFIDSEELLQSLVKDGEFVYENPPQVVKTKGVPFQRKPKKILNEQQSEYLARAERDRVVHKDEEIRLFKQRQRNIELQEKCGLIPFRKLKVDKPRKECKYADTCGPTLEEVMRDMKIFDKLTQNPVQIPDYSDLQ